MSLASSSVVGIAVQHSKQPSLHLYLCLSSSDRSFFIALRFIILLIRSISVFFQDTIAKCDTILNLLVESFMNFIVLASDYPVSFWPHPLITYAILFLLFFRFMRYTIEFYAHIVFWEIYVHEIERFRGEYPFFSNAVYSFCFEYFYCFLLCWNKCSTLSVKFRKSLFSQSFFSDFFFCFVSHGLSFVMI